MTDGPAATLHTVGATVRAGFSGLAPSVRACWAALLGAVLISALSQTLPSPVAILALPIEIAVLESDSRRESVLEAEILFEAKR